MPSYKNTRHKNTQFFTNMNTIPAVICLQIHERKRFCFLNNNRKLMFYVYFVRFCLSLNKTSVSWVVIWSKSFQYTEHNTNSYRYSVEHVVREFSPGHSLRFHSQHGASAPTLQSARQELSVNFAGNKLRIGSI